MKIYGLFDPNTNELRYVGRTKRPLGIRLSRHLSDKVKLKTHKHNWLDYLKSKGQKPTIELLDDVPDLEWEFWETWYSQYFRGLGCRLTNSVDGGGGNPNPSAETRRRMSIAHIGHKHSEATKIKCRSAWHKLPEDRKEELKRKSSERWKGRVFTEEQLKANAEKHRGKIPWNKKK